MRVMFVRTDNVWLMVGGAEDLILSFPRDDPPLLPRVSLSDTELQDGPHSSPSQMSHVLARVGS